MVIIKIKNLQMPAQRFRSKSSHAKENYSSFQGEAIDVGSFFDVISYL